MKVQADGEELFEVLPWEKSLLENDIVASVLEEDCHRRLKWVLKHKIDQCWIRFEKEWMEKLRADPAITSIPTDKESFVNMVRGRPDYKDAATREEERRAALNL